MGGRGGSPNAGRVAQPPPSSSPAPAPAAPAAPQSLDARIMSSIDSLPQHWRVGEWKTLKGLREAMSDVPSADLEKALKSLDRAQRIELVWDFDTSKISASEKAAGFQFGGKLVTAFRRR